MDWVKIIFCSAGLALGIFLFIRTLKNHRRIDTESIAEVSKVEPLGRSDMKPVYAIWYSIKSSAPFDLLVTPCKKPLDIGERRGIFYEKDNAQKNYYFKTIGSLDKRFVIPIGIILACSATIIHSIIKVFFL